MLRSHRRTSHCKPSSWYLRSCASTRNGTRCSPPPPSSSSASAASYSESDVSTGGVVGLSGGGVAERRSAAAAPSSFIEGSFAAGDAFSAERSFIASWRAANAVVLPLGALGDVASLTSSSGGGGSGAEVAGAPRAALLARVRRGDTGLASAAAPMDAADELRLSAARVTGGASAALPSDRADALGCGCGAGGGRACGRANACPRSPDDPLAAAAAPASDAMRRRAAGGSACTLASDAVRLWPLSALALAAARVTRRAGVCSAAAAGVARGSSSSRGGRPSSCSKVKPMLTASSASGALAALSSAASSALAPCMRDPRSHSCCTTQAHAAAQPLSARTTEPCIASTGVL